MVLKKGAGHGSVVANEPTDEIQCARADRDLGGTRQIASVAHFRPKLSLRNAERRCQTHQYEFLHLRFLQMIWALNYNADDGYVLGPKCKLQYTKVCADCQGIRK